MQIACLQMCWPAKEQVFLALVRIIPALRGFAKILRIKKSLSVISRSSWHRLGKWTKALKSVNENPFSAFIVEKMLPVSLHEDVSKVFYF